MSPRIRASLIHLSLSAVVALLSLLLVFGLWYPSPLYTALDVTHIFLLLLAVDVSLGPLLTFIVFKVGKKTLLFDLTVIGVLQLLALVYGLYTVAQGRPAWVVYNIDRFDIVQVVDIDKRKITEAALEYQKPSLTGPRWVGAIRPQSKEERTDIMFEAAAGGNDIAQRPNLYRPLEEFHQQIVSRAQALEKLNDLNPPETVKSVLEKWPRAGYWVPLKARAKPMVVFLDKENYSVISVVDLNPWP